MTHTVTLLNIAVLSDAKAENIRKAVICWDENPLDAINLVFKFLLDTRPTQIVENLNTSLNCWQENPQDSLNFLLKSLSDNSSDSDPLENLRVALINFNSDPKLAFHSTFKSVMTPIHLKYNNDFLENLRVAFLQLDDNQKLAFNLILKALEELPKYKDLGDLRKGFLSLNEKNELESINHFLRFFGDSAKNEFVSQTRKAIQKFPQANWIDAFSFGQIQSKQWLLEEYNKLNLDPAEMVFVLGGWYGLLPAFAETQQMPLGLKYRSFDIDPECAPIAETINKHLLLQDWKFKATTEDIHNINYQQHDYETLRSNGSGVRLIESPDLVINTSCEHIENFEEWYGKVPEGKTLILQSNNFFDEATHVNCSKNLEEFREACPMSEVLYAGEKTFPQYTRFMLIGRK